MQTWPSSLGCRVALSVTCLFASFAGLCVLLDCLCLVNHKTSLTLCVQCLSKIYPSNTINCANIIDVLLSYLIWVLKTGNS